MLNGDEQPGSKGDFMYLNPNQSTIWFNGRSARSRDYGEMFHFTAKINYNNDLLFYMTSCKESTWFGHKEQRVWINIMFINNNNKEDS